MKPSICCTSTWFNLLIVISYTTRDSCNDLHAMGQICEASVCQLTAPRLEGHGAIKTNGVEKIRTFVLHNYYLTETMKSWAQQMPMCSCYHMLFELRNIWWSLIDIEFCLKHAVSYLKLSDTKQVHDCMVILLCLWSIVCFYVIKSIIILRYFLLGDTVIIPPPLIKTRGPSQ